MPKSLEEFNNLQPPVSRHGGAKVDWKKIAQKIRETQQAYTVKEVHEDKNLVNRAVTPYRTKNALDKLAEDKLLSRLWDGKRFYYGDPAAVGQ